MAAGTTKTTFKAGDPRAVEAQKRAVAARAGRRTIGLPPMTEAQKVMQAFQGLVPGAMQVLADAVGAGDRRVALAIADRAAPPERLMALEARAQIDALQLALLERDEQIAELQGIIDELTGEARDEAA